MRFIIKYSHIDSNYFVARITPFIRHFKNQCSSPRQGAPAILRLSLLLHLTLISLSFSNLLGFISPKHILMRAYSLDAYYAFSSATVQPACTASAPSLRRRCIFEWARDGGCHSKAPSVSFYREYILNGRAYTKCLLDASHKMKYHHG